jgi:ferric-dicitrate binding protein FerR (iron transport regulator)
MEDKYLTYTPIQIAGEDSFIRWVRHGENKNAWMEWLHANPSQKQKLDEARLIVLSLSAVSHPALTETDAKTLWTRIDQSIQSGQQKPIIRPLRPLWQWAIAAAAALTLVVWFNSLIISDHVYAQAGEQQIVNLPEESVVTLNAGSSIAYKSKSFQQDRILRLDGEAFFKVKPGSSFTVKTEYGSVTVLGTSFNIISRPGRFEVSCYTGKVRVENKSQDQVVITPGEKSTQRMDDLKFNQTTFIPNGEHPEWIEGKFTFDDQPLDIVFNELERQYDVKVKLAPGMDKLKYTGLFESGDLEKAISLITWPRHLKSKVEGRKVTISY